jgi:hypothetical protein
MSTVRRPEEPEAGSESRASFPARPPPPLLLPASALPTASEASMDARTRADVDAQFDRAVAIVQGLPKTGPIQTGYEAKLAMYRCAPPVYMPRRSLLTRSRAACTSRVRDVARKGGRER